MSVRAVSTRSSALTTKAVLVALYVILATYVSIRVGNIRITFASLPIVLAALIYGPTTAGVVGACGELVNQLLIYGLNYTTPLWIIPPAARGILLGLAVKIGWATGRKFYTANIIVALVVTMLNTLVIYLDSVLLGYFSWVYVLGSFIIRIISSIITAIVVGILAISIHKSLKGQGW